MEFKVGVPKISGDIVALVLVAEAMARAKATAYGATEFHKPAFDGVLRNICASLLNEARKGCLQVCDQDGFAASADELIERAKRAGSYSTVSRYVIEPDWDALRNKHPEAEMPLGYWDWTGIDLGEKVVDEVVSELLCLYATLKCLNDWGASAGNSFSIDPNAPPWIDERGVMGLTETLANNGSWDMNTPDVRQFIAALHDAKYRHDPENSKKDVALWNYVTLVRENEREIAEWELMNHQGDPNKAKTKKDELTKLRAEREALIIQAEVEFGVVLIDGRWVTKTPEAGTGATAEPGTSKETKPQASDGDWIAKACAKAQELGLKKWKEEGVRQITARNICDAVATELAKDPTTHGLQGPRSSSNVRVEGLRGWQFKPPKEEETVD